MDPIASLKSKSFLVEVATVKIGKSAEYLRDI